MKKRNIYFIKKNDKIKNAILKIRKNGTRTVLVVDKKHKLLGSLSEGDIQKALVKNKKLSSSVYKIYNSNPKKLNENNINKNLISKIFLEGQYGLLPVVNKRGVVKKVITWNEIFNYTKNKIVEIDVIIMAGGKGLRLLPLTQVLPKPLVPINGKPMLEHILDNFKNFKFKNVYLILNHQANLIKSYFQNYDKNISLQYFKEPEPLGTIGGIKSINTNISENFLLTNCDTLFRIDFNKLIDFHKKNKNLITVLVSKNQLRYPYGLCKIKNGKLFSILEKPKFNFICNAGLYVMNKKVLKLIPKKKFDTTDLLKKCLKLNYNIGVFEISNSSWTDLGQLSDFKKAAGKF